MALNRSTLIAGQLTSNQPIRSHSSHHHSHSLSLSERKASTIHSGRRSPKRNHSCRHHSSLAGRSPQGDLSRRHHSALAGRTPQGDLICRTHFSMAGRIPQGNRLCRLQLHQPEFSNSSTSHGRRVPDKLRQIGNNKALTIFHLFTPLPATRWRQNPNS
ncbi:hypothetical protein NPIL_265651 [Nephila pilipes]|uniref:Uncharacterized protein n=1 Tax=Nephila pilipes TaxID=299642 RepID=A0A8X6I9M9_NEPPI|nr:hypothetical protein NPIL_265651 [Nephila pilipes]